MYVPFGHCRHVLLPDETQAKEKTAATIVIEHIVKSTYITSFCPKSVKHFLKIKIPKYIRFAVVGRL